MVTASSGKAIKMIGVAAVVTQGLTTHTFSCRLTTRHSRIHDHRQNGLEEPAA